MKKKLPIGIQTFRNIRDKTENFVYIDKTKIALDIISNGRFYFLSRPRRFGKSLFLDTLSDIFKGNKHLFEGLAIYDKWDWNDVYPVVKVSFGSGSYTKEVYINNEFERIFRENNESLELDIQYEGVEHSRKSFDLLICETYKKYKKPVVVLVDEYDKLIIDNIANEDKEFALNARSTLRNFYSALKDNEDKLRFVFLTGVSKFSKLNLFSGLNNIQDITLNTDYATITGYTHDDVLREFSEYTSGVDMEEVRKWYNGYNYFGEPIYNPFDILLFFSNKCEFSNYWWETGNPAFLIELLKKKIYSIPELANITVSKETLSALDLDDINLIALLWQTGYLTFDKEIRAMSMISYKMKIPNLEIQISLNNLFLNFLTDLKTEKTQKQLNVAQSVIDDNYEGLRDSLYSFFASIPYTNYVNNTIGQYEGYYASVIYTFFASIGFDITPEDITDKGRIDMTLKSPEKILIMEFKVDKTKESAMQQIKSKKYYEKYLNDGRKIILIGIHFSSEEKNIVGFEWEEL